MRDRASALAMLIALTFVVREGRGGERDPAAAEALFQQGRALVGEGKYAEGCAKLAESQRLDPADGTSINLGQCWEKVERFASAWAAYHEGAALADARGERARADFARSRARALEPKLARLRIQVAPKARADGLVIKRDAVTVGEAAWGEPLPIDPGASLVEASAPGRRPYTVRIAVTPGTTTTIDIPPLAREQLGAAALPSPKASPLRTVGIGGAIAGAAAVVTGLALGAVAKSRNDTARADECIVPLGCTARGASMIDDARSFADASTVLVIAGASVAVLGVVLALVSSSPAPRSTGSTLAVGYWR
jgi:hypothetical protein